MIQAFKKNLVARETPRGLVYLNRLIILIMLLGILLQSFDFWQVTAEVQDKTAENELSINVEWRTLSITQLSSNLISYFDVAKNLEFVNFDIPLLNHYQARFEYLGRIVQSEAD